MKALDLDFQNPEAYTDIPTSDQFKNWIQAACPLETAYSVSVRIVNEQEAHMLNNQYRKIDKATNVLSFPFDPPPIPMETRHLGDLVLCKQIVENEALEQNKHIDDHWAHMIIHGTLHLQGYDHLSDEQAQTMESLEISLLKKMGITNPYIKL